LFGGFHPTDVKTIFEYKPATETFVIFGQEMRDAIYIVLLNIYHERWDRLSVDAVKKCILGMSVCTIFCTRCFAILCSIVQIQIT
jgi:hypothetical protein